MIFSLLRRKVKMAEGRVKWFNEILGYGFILSSEGKEIYVHYKDIEGGGFRTLDEGEPVNFEIFTGPKGFQAKNVEKIAE